MKTEIIRTHLTRGDTLLEPLQFELDTGSGFNAMDLNDLEDIKITLRTGQSRSAPVLAELDLTDGLTIDSVDSSILTAKLKPSVTDDFVGGVIYGDVQFYMDDTIPEDDRFTYVSLVISIREDI